MEEWLYHLYQPLPGQEKVVTDAVREDEGESFMNFMAQHNANVGGRS